MTSRRINSLLYTAAVAMALASVGVVAWALVPDVPDTVVQAARKPNATSRVSSARTEVTAMLASLEPVFARKFRGSMAVVAAPPPSLRPTSRPQAVPAAFTLVGTIGTSTALLRTPDGNVVARSVGQSVGGTELIAVRDGEVEVRTGARVSTLRKPAGKGAP